MKAAPPKAVKKPAKKVVRRVRAVPAPTPMMAAVAAPPEPVPAPVQAPPEPWPPSSPRRWPSWRRRRPCRLSARFRLVNSGDPRDITRVKVTANDQPVHDHAFMPPLPPQQFYRAVPDPVAHAGGYGPGGGLVRSDAVALEYPGLPPRAVGLEVSADVTGPGTLELVGEWPAPQGGNLVFA